MSYHASVNCHTCGNTLNKEDHLPYGLKPLFAELGAPVVEWNGKPGVEVLSALQNAIYELTMDSSIGYYRRKYDTEGEWSVVDFALPFLQSMRDGICRDPHGLINIT